MFLRENRSIVDIIDDHSRTDHALSAVPDMHLIGKEMNIMAIFGRAKRSR